MEKQISGPRGSQDEGERSQGEGEPREKATGTAGDDQKGYDMKETALKRFQSRDRKSQVERSAPSKARMV